ADASGRPEERDERGDAVWADIEGWATAWAAVEAVDCFVPGFVAVAGHERDRCDGRADPTVVDDFAAGLQASAEECVGCAAEEHTVFSGGVNQDDCLIPGSCQGLFRVN